MYFDTHFDFRESVMNEFCEKEMQRTREQALRNLSKVVHSNFDLFSRVLASAFFDKQEDAMILAHKLNIGKYELLALIDDYDGFKEMVLQKQDYLNEQQLAQSF
jgi:hypothetical protein